MMDPGDLPAPPGSYRNPHPPVPVIEEPTTPADDAALSGGMAWDAALRKDPEAHLRIIPKDAPAGVAERDAALDLLDATRATWIAECRAHLRALYRERAGGTDRFVTGDDAVDFLDARGCREDFRLIGAVFRPLTDWRRLGYRPSRIRRRHARPIACWQYIGA